MDVKFSEDELKISEWERLPTSEKLNVLHGLSLLFHKQTAIWLAAGAITVIGLTAVGLLVAAFTTGAAEPQWAQSAIAAIMAAAIALIFQSHGARNR